MESNCAMRREVIYREFKRGNRMSMAITINPLKTGRAPTYLTPFMKRMKREGILRKATHYETVSESEPASLMMESGALGLSSAAKRR
jgi:hypothetical protein